MILTPIPRDQLAAALDRFAAQLDDPDASAAFARIGGTSSERARSIEAERHRQEALRVAAHFGVPVHPPGTRPGFNWDGAALDADTEAYVILHEVAHFVLAPPERRSLIDFGLGPGPDTSERAAAEAAAVVPLLEREAEEAEASLLGVLWEAALGQPALASFLDQNWLEGLERSAAAHFTGVFMRLCRRGVIDPGLLPASSGGTPRPRGCSAGMAMLTQTKARPGWWTILTHFWAELDRDHVSIMAAGVAFYALLSIFPGMSALISLYGLVADPVAIEKLLSSVAGVLPQEALKLLSDQLHALVAAPRDKLGLGLLVSLLLAIWSATSGTGALMQALTVAYEEREERGILTYYGLAIALTIGVGVFALLSLFLIAVVPAVIGALPMSQDWQERLSWIRWPLLAVLALIALSALYRFAPSRREPCWHCFSAGTIAAALLWLIGSAGFSFYVARFSSYDKTYGSLGAVVILLMWFYVTAYIILAGAELNSEIEKAEARR